MFVVTAMSVVLCVLLAFCSLGCVVIGRCLYISCSKIRDKVLVSILVAVMLAIYLSIGYYVLCC